MSESKTRSKEITCIVCPNGCRISVAQGPSGELAFDGSTCDKGEEYATDEFLAPKRMLITTMRIQNGSLPVIPVRSRQPIPKERIFDAMDLVNRTTAAAPVSMGDVLVPDIFDTGIDIVASRDVATRESRTVPGEAR
jgi:CxxC motif-containing protein